MSLTIYAEFRTEPFEALTIAVVGLGYIGLPTAAALAKAGHRVIGVDINPQIVSSVNRGACTIVEPGLDALVSETVDMGALRAVADMPVADAYLIAVPTPVGPEGERSADLRYVFEAADEIAPTLRPGALVILESTSPVGATRQVIERMARLRPDLRFPDSGAPDQEVDIDVAYSPERVIPGRTLVELGTNARVLGGATPGGALRAARLYRSLTAGELLLTDDRSAELVKLVENAFRDVNIAFANELSLVCDHLDMNVWEVIALANRHPRVSILQPGPGVGGHCIAVDPWFIINEAPEQTRLMRAARDVNDGKPEFILARARALLDQNPEAKAACLGLTFKADVDDFRESPSLEIARALSRSHPGRVVCVDPYADALADIQGLFFIPLEEALSQGLVIGLVGHQEFRKVERPTGKIIDACGLWT